MIRIILENIILLLLPTLAYLLFMFVKRRSQPDHPDASKSVWDDAPLLYLFGAGVVLVMLVLLFVSRSSGWEPGKTYIPPVYKDGKIQPGRSE